MFSSKPKMDIREVQTIVEGLKKLYKLKMKPLEEHYLYHEFHSPFLQDSDFEAKPMVLLLGQYSTGKTTFISFLIDREFPGSHIGPEPTTDRFIAVMGGKEDRVTPGNALAVQPDKPFRGLELFGTGFLTKFQSAECNAPLLDEITFIDTPGVLSGEKQRIGRQYDFVKVCEWFAERSDLILFLFDAHKLDISDEFKRAIEALRGHDEKIRVVLNKADMVGAQQLMRVYGALMWSLGKVIRTPEVVRVYIGSFWNQPLQHTDNAKLFQVEQADLLRDLRNLPSNSTVRKVNELVKRARLAKIHALIISSLKKEMPAVFGKSGKQEELISNMRKEFDKIQRQYNLPIGDFPDVQKFQDICKRFEFNKHFNKYNAKLIDTVEEFLTKDMPALMSKFPPEILRKEKAGTSAETILSTDMGFAQRLRDSPETRLEAAESSQRASTAAAAAAAASASSSASHSAPPPTYSDPFSVSDDERRMIKGDFYELGPVDGKLSGEQVKGVLVKSGLANDLLKKIWVMSDIDRDAKLDLDEFVIAVTLAKAVRGGAQLPAQLPASLMPVSKMDTPF